MFLGILHCAGRAEARHVAAMAHHAEEEKRLAALQSQSTQKRYTVLCVGFSFEVCERSKIVNHSQCFHVPYYCMHVLVTRYWVWNTHRVRVVLFAHIW